MKIAMCDLKSFSFKSDAPFYTKPTKNDSSDLKTCKCTKSSYGQRSTKCKIIGNNRFNVLQLASHFMHKCYKNVIQYE